MTEIPEHPGPTHKMVARSLAFRTILRWVTGFILSLFLIWAITAVGTETYYSRVWSEELQKNIPLPGTMHNSRNEAWATTKFGELGLPGTPEIEDASVPKILIWGDSFVAAFEVEDELKMHNQLGKMLDAGQDPSYQSISVGWRFQSFADYIFQIPVYEELIQPVALHVIHIHTLEDMYPDRPDRISLFLSEPEFHFVRHLNEFQEPEAPEKFSTAKDLIYRMRLHFFLKMKKRLFQIARLEDLRFSPGLQSIKRGRTQSELDSWRISRDALWTDMPPPRAAWEFAIESLLDRTDAPVLFVYAPETPFLNKGRLHMENSEADLAEEFGLLCKERGIGFISMEDSFQEFVHRNGRFYKGFAKSRPWEGHYNADGHHLVAEAIHSWIKENRDVVHPD